MPQKIMTRNTLLLLFLFMTCFAWAKENLFRPKQQAHPLLENRIRVWLQQLDDPKQNAAVEKNLLQIGEIADPFLLKALESKIKPSTKIQIIKILRTRQNDRCTTTLIRCLENSDQPPEVREQAALALAFFNSTNIFYVLGQYALDPNVDRRIYTAAAEALCQLSNKEVIPYLILLLKHWDKVIANRAYQKLGEITGRINAPADFTAWQKWWEANKDLFEQELY